MKHFNRYVAVLFVLFFMYYLTNFLNLVKFDNNGNEIFFC